MEKWFRQHTHTDNSAAVLTNLVYYMGVKISRQELTATWQQHPYSHTLASLVDVLREWNIDALSLEVTLSELDNIPYPAIAQLKAQQSSLVMISELKDGLITYIDPETGWIQEPVDAFASKWTGRLIVAEATPAAGSSAKQESSRTQLLKRVPHILFAGALLVLMMVAVVEISYSESTFAQSFLALLPIKIAGMVLSVALLLHESGRRNSLVDRVCKSGKHSNCEAVLGSRAARLTAWLSMSEIGMMYFAGGIVVTLVAAFSGRYHGLFGWLALFNLLALPYTFFSLYYQAKVLKKWCLLCTAVQGILWLECMVAASHLSAISFGDLLQNTWMSGACFLLPVLVWWEIKPLLSSAQQVPMLEKELLRFKTHTPLFTSLLSQQPSVFHLPPPPGLVLGNPGAALTLTLVTNPQCAPCADAHREIEKLLEKYGQDFRLNLVFSFGEQHPDESATQFCKHLLSVAPSTAPTELRAMLQKWYAQPHRSYREWSAGFPPVCEVSAQQAEQVLMRQLMWCEMANVGQTPSLFINHYRLPEVYSIPDLQYHVTTLSLQISNQYANN